VSGVEKKVLWTQPVRLKPQRCLSKSNRDSMPFVSATESMGPEIV
jgi:hypothetical protein